MKLIVGLGNPGEKYKNNRHNVGYMFVDYLVHELTSLRVNEFTHDKKTNSKLAKLVINNKEIVLIKPRTFMNLSGQAVKNVLADYRLPITDLLIVHDDLDIPLGKFKIQKGIGPKLHNGIESIENVLGTKDFWRVRIGVDNRQTDNWIDGEAYVLQDFRPEEKKIAYELFPMIYDRLKINFFP